VIDTKVYRVAPGQKVKLSRLASDDRGGLKREDTAGMLAKLTGQMGALQERLYAESRQSLLVVIQAMDAGGKDSTIRHVFGPINPQGCQVTNFKAPSQLERGHDFLWRIHQHAPRRGHIAVFNRSHYEDVLIVRVKKLVEQRCWKRRYEHINAFEKLLADEGTRIVKFYLHISKDYQKQRLQRRLDRPDKHWKFNPADLDERRRWGAYRRAFEDVFERCSSKAAPWYIIPAEQRWYRDLLVAQVVVETLTAMKLRYPKPDFDPSTITIT
jgi:PPK2 family polyphosphate:nucleotide phosphotransferase